MRAFRKSRFNAQIYEEAAEWLITLRTGGDDPAAREALDEWLRRSPEHVKAYLEVSTIWEDVPLHDPAKALTAQDHIARARADESSNVLALDGRRPGESVPISPPRARRLRFALAASAAFALVGTATLAGWWYLQRNTYGTTVGEQRSIALPDGSLIELNARSRIRVEFSSAERDVELLDGQALFTVAKDPSRPFLVKSDGTTVRALGTEFDVYRKSTGTTVTVLEGTVAILPTRGQEIPLPTERNGNALPPPLGEGRRGSGGEGIAAPLLLSANQQITVTALGSATPIRSANLAAATAWTQRRLVFDSAPLADVVEEFNRYNARPLIISDPGIANLKVVGVFSSTDPSSLLAFLRAQPGIQVADGGDEIRIVSAPR